MQTHTLLLALSTLATAGLSSVGTAQLTLVSQFNAGLGGLVGAAYDPSTDSPWVYDSFGPQIRRFSPTGTALGGVDQPGEAADDADLDFTFGATTLGSTTLGPNTLLHANGETGVAEIYAIDKATGAVLATLTTSFGASHVVGMAHHAGRNSLFLLQDNAPSSDLDNLVAEVSLTTGAVLNTFETGDFNVSFGDIEVHHATGNLLLASSLESAIREVTPLGAVVRDWALPTGVSDISGIGLDDFRGEAWLSSSSSNGNVYRVSGLQAVPEPTTMAALGLGALVLLRRRRG